MKFEIKNKLDKLLKKEKVTLNKNVGEVKYIRNSFYNNFHYSRYEKIKIDKDFNYKHNQLTGNIEADFELLFKIWNFNKDDFVLKHSFYDNLLRIKRSHDITLFLDGDSYFIFNGRHRLIYLKYFLMSKNNNLDCYIPALVNRNIQSLEANKILNSLINDYGAFIRKYNYYDDNLAFVIVIVDMIYIVNNLEELEDFYKNIDSSYNKYYFDYCNLEEDINYDQFFKEIYKLSSSDLLQMDFLELLYFIKNNSIMLDNKVISIHDLDVSRLYDYYHIMCSNIQYCKVHDYEVPSGLDILKSHLSNFNKCGHMIMDFIYNNPQVKNLSWETNYE